MVVLVTHGLSNDEIADALVLSPVTAKTHVSRAMIKLGARDRAQLAVFADQTGRGAPRAAGLYGSMTLSRSRSCRPAPGTETGTVRISPVRGPLASR